MDILDTLLAHNAQTTAKLIEQSRGLTDAQLDQDFDLAHRTVRKSLDHIIESMEWWTDLMNGQPQRTFDALGADPLSLDGLQKRLENVAPQLAEISRKLQSDGRLDEKFPPREDWPKPFRNGATIVHVLTHGAHHRSQVIHMLRRLGVPDVIWGDALGF